MLATLLFRSRAISTYVASQPDLLTPDLATSSSLLLTIALLQGAGKEASASSLIHIERYCATILLAIAMKNRAQLRGLEVCLEMLSSREAMSVLTASADISASLMHFGEALLQEISAALVLKVGEEGTGDSSSVAVSLEREMEKEEEERKRDNADKAGQWKGYLQTLRRLTKAWQSGLAGEEANKID